MGNLKGMIEMIKEVVPDNQAEVAKRLQEGKFSLRDMYEQFQNMMKMGPLNKGALLFSLKTPVRSILTRTVMEMLPGMSNLMQNVKGDVGQTKIKAYMTIMDSMTDEGRS